MSKPGDYERGLADGRREMAEKVMRAEMDRDAARRLSEQDNAAVLACISAFKRLGLLREEDWFSLAAARAAIERMGR